MGIVAQALAHIDCKFFEPVGGGRTALAGPSLYLEMGSYGLAVSAQMAGYRRNRPAPFALVAWISTNSSCGNIGAGLLSRPLFCTYAAWIAGPAC